MPIIHTVLVKLKPGVDTSLFVEKATAKLGGMSMITGFRVGFDIGVGDGRSKGYEFGMVLEFVDEDVGGIFVLFRQLIGTVLNFAQALAAYNEQIGDVNGKFIGPYADGASSCLVFWNFVL